MSEGKNTYEGMFLVQPSQSDFEHAGEPVRAVLDRSEAEILSINPWDERRLAYEIRGNRRGLYILTYFKVAPDNISEIEHDCQLNEGILRVLILRRDHLTDEQIQAATPATARAERARVMDAERAERAERAEKAEKAERAAASGDQTGQDAQAAPDAQADAAEAVAAAALAEEPADGAEAAKEPDAPAETQAVEAAPAEPAAPEPTVSEPAAPQNDAAPAEDDRQNQPS